MLSSCLVILNYNGQEHLDDCLSTALAAAKKLEKPCPVIFVDNRSTDNDVEYVKAHFPEVEVQLSAKNDYLFSLNNAIAKRSEEVVILLNNDMRFDTDFIQPLLAHFEQPEMFAVSAKTMTWDGSGVLTSRRIGYFKNFWFYRKWDHEIKHSCYSLEFCGGACAIRRKMFLSLGGFDRLYFPGYYEDADISYRAWKNGWKVVYEPNSVVYHKRGSSFKKEYDKSKIERLMHRNEILFTVKNCGIGIFVYAYLFLLPLRAFRQKLAGNSCLALGILDSFKKIPMALSERFKMNSKNKVKEAEFLSVILSS